MFRRNKLTLLQSKDGRIKVINERIVLTERHLLSLCNSFAATTRKIARNRDIYDELAKGFRSYTDEEEINESLTEGLKNFSNALTILGDYMDHNVHRMEAKVVNELAQIEQLCKTTRDNLRAAVVARDKEVIKQKQLIDIKSKFNANNTAADSELVKAKLEVNRANKKIDEIINNFEKRKLSLVKEVLSNFIQISLKYHTKSIEALTASFYDISNIDEQGDLQEFKKAMKSKEDLQQKTFLSKKALMLKSKSMEHLDNNSDTALSPLKRASRLSRSQKSLAAQESDDYDDEEEDEGEEEDDDEEEEEFDENSEEDSGSASEDEDDDSGSHGIPGKTKRRIEDTKEKWNKPPLQRQPFKAVNVTKASSRLRKPFAAAATAEGIPSKGGTFSKPSSSSSRLITVVEPKGSSKRPHRGGDAEGDERLD